MRKKSENNEKKMRKSGPRPSQKEQDQNTDGIREASSEGGEAPPKGGLEGRLVNSRLTRWGVQDPRALFNFANPAEAARRRRTSNVRLPLELPSDRPQTSAKHVSDNLQKSICSKTIWRKKCF